MISYSSQQQNLATRIHERLKALGHSPKLDRLDISFGERFQKTLAWWLSACHVAVVLLSEDAAASPWVRYELSVLVNRELVGQDVKLVPLFVDGFSRAVIKQRADLAPLQIEGIHSVQCPDVLSDAELDALLAEAVPAAEGDAAIDRLAGSVYDHLIGLGTNRVAVARRRLGSTDQPRDPWFDDAELAAEADGGARLRRALARELCAHTLHTAYGALQELAQDRYVGDDVYHLVELNLMTTFDSAALTTLLGGWRRAFSVVLAITSQGLAELAAAAVQRLHDTNLVYCFSLQGPLTGASAREVAAGLAEELRVVMRHRGHRDPDESVRVMAGLGHPVFALLTRVEGLRAEVLRLLAQEFRGVAFVVLATRDMEPSRWSDALSGVAVAGPDLRGVAWQDFVDAEAALIERWDVTREGLDLVLEYTRR